MSESLYDEKNEAITLVHTEQTLKDGEKALSLEEGNSLKNMLSKYVALNAELMVLLFCFVS